MYLQKNVSYLKMKYKLTYQEICSQAGINMRTVTRLLKTDGKNLRIDTVMRVAELFQISIDDLIYKDLEKDQK